MSILQILGSGFLVLVLWLVLQQYKSNISVFVVVAFGVLIFLSMAGQLENMLQTLLRMSQEAGVNVIYLTTILKMTGIAWLTEFLIFLLAGSGVPSEKYSGNVGVNLSVSLK